jgi:hypothetical protein
MSIDVNVTNDLVIVTESSEDIVVNVSNAAGPQGPAGAAGQGVPVGGTTGQVLKKSSGTNYDTFWSADNAGVPYSGATGDVDLGGNDLKAGSVFLEGASGAGGALRIKQFASSAANLDGYSTISTLNTGVFYFTSATTSPNFKNFVLNPSGLTDNTLRTYTLPNLSGTLALLSDITPGLTSVGLSMPSAFAVSNSPLTSNGTLAVTGAGTASQYVRGDGQLANFPTNGGGGSSVNYYLNGSITQGTFGGETYYEMSKTPVLGAGTDFTRTNAQGDGYIASFITDAGDPSLLNIPGGNWNLEFYFESSASGGSPQFYGEVYKVDASNNFTLVASGSTNPEGITNGTIVDQYFTSIPVPQTSLLVTDRLAIRIYVITSGRTITLHTEDGNLCEVLTTFSTGLNALNGLTAQVQYFATGTSGTDFAISSATDTHTFNLPTASATNRGALSSADWSTFSGKVGGSGATNFLPKWTSGSALGNSAIYDNGGNIGIGTTTASSKLYVVGDATFFNATNNVGFSLISGTSAYSTYVHFATGSLRIYSTFAGVDTISLTSAGNLLIGTTTDGGQRLQVQGDAYIKGSGATSATNGFTIQNSASTELVRVDNSGQAFFSNRIAVNRIQVTSTANQLELVGGIGGATGGTGIQLGQFTNATNTSGTFDRVLAAGSFLPTSGTGLFNGIQISASINQTGGANGITRGLYVNPTLTAAADWRSIEWSNNTGWGLYGAGTADNYLAGKLLIGTTTVSTFALDVNGTARVSGAATFSSSVTATSFIKSGGTSAQILAADGSVITAGTNITISGGTISSSGGGGGSMAIGGSITSATAGSVLFAGTSGVLAQKNANFFWDNTNNRLGIGTTAPATGLQVNGQITINTTGIAGQSAFISTNKPAISNGNNIFIGNGGSALTAAGSTQAANLTGVGFQCLQNNTTGESATAVGFQSMTSNTTGNNNSAFGVGAMYSNTTGQQNTALGFNTLNANISGNYNVAIGNEALKGGTANSENVMIGWRNGYVTTTGAYNTGVGSNALLGITSGQLNVGFGWRAAQSVTSGNYNCAFGGQALNATTGSNNHAFGFSAGQNNTTGSNNIFIGFQTNGVAATDSNRTFIGNSSTTSTWLGGNLLLGSTTDGGQRLQVTGDTKLSGRVKFTPQATPSTPAAGDVYYDSTTNKLRCYNGTIWNDLF